MDKDGKRTLTLMKKNIRSEEEVINEFFKGKGFLVEKILESELDSPDFFLRDNKNTYLVEFKIKHDEDGFEEEREETLKRGDPFDILEGIGRNNFISKRIRKGEKQLQIKLSQDADFRIIWYHAAGRFPNVHFDQLRATIYGAADIVSRGEQRPMLPCLYFSFSEFYRYKNSLDAAILTYTDQAQFCLNNYSPKYDKLRTTKLFETFIGGIYDPLIEELKGNAYIADCGMDRRNEADILEYIEKKYQKKKMVKMEPTLISIEVALDRDQEQGDNVVIRKELRIQRSKEVGEFFVNEDDEFYRGDVKSRIEEAVSKKISESSLSSEKYDQLQTTIAERYPPESVHMDENKLIRSTEIHVAIGLVKLINEEEDLNRLPRFKRCLHAKGTVICKVIWSTPSNKDNESTSAEIQDVRCIKIHLESS